MCRLLREVCPFCGWDMLYCDDHTPENESDQAREDHIRLHVEEMTDV